LNFFLQIVIIEMQFPHPDARILPANIPLSHSPLNSQSKEQEKIVGSLVGLAIGDALGASVEFRPRQYLVDHPVKDMQGGGTWGLQAGQWTDDTSMALCLAASLITQHGFNPYDQMVRYKWWYKKGFLSSTGQCFDIGSTTRTSLEEFSRRQSVLKQHFRTEKDEDIDNLSFDQVKSVSNFNVVCGLAGQAGNGPLMRLAPVPLFYFRDPESAVRLAGESARLTHGDQKAVDACRYYAALIVAAINGRSKDELLSNQFYEKNQQWFGRDKLHDEVLSVAHGSYKKSGGYDDGIRGKNYIVNTLQAALWAFWSDGNSFEQGALNAVNLGDDTDTTAAVYGQLAGAYYGISAIPRQWARQLYAMNLIISVGEWLYFEGSRSRSDTTRQQQQQPQKQQQQQQRITPQNQTQTKMLASQSGQHPGSYAFTQQNPTATNIGYMGYGPQNRQKTSQHAQAQASSQMNTTSNLNTSRLHDKKRRLDPAALPAAGVPSGSK
jgi:ADP-ribosylglycohydrolase